MSFGSLELEQRLKRDSVLIRPLHNSGNFAEMGGIISIRQFYRNSPRACQPFAVTEGGIRLIPVI